MHWLLAGRLNVAAGLQNLNSSHLKSHDFKIVFAHPNKCFQKLQLYRQIVSQLVAEKLVFKRC